MKTTDKFDYTSNWGKTYKDCNFVVGEYSNNFNNYLGIVNDIEGEIITCSVNCNRVNSKDEIGIKNYSENEGMVKFLQDIGIIEDEPIAVEHSGFVLVPYYKLTKSGIELFDGQK